MIYTSPYGNIPELDKGNALVEFYRSPYRKQAMDAVAFIDPIGGIEYTNRQMQDMAARWATVLRESYSISDSDTIVLSMLNSVYMQPLHFGALSLGAIISPANISYTASELAHQVRMVSPKLVICGDFNAELVREALRLAGSEALVLLQSNVESMLQGLDSTTPMTAPQPLDGLEHAAYYCFSSGTSGLPKCVITTHQNMISVVHQQDVAAPANYVGIDITAAVLPMSHIYGLSSFLWILPYFAKPNVIYPKFEFEPLLQGIIKYRLDNLNVVPPIVLLLAKSPLVDKYPEVKGLLKSIKSGAAPISRSTVELLSDRFPGIEVVNGYGMTEMSPGSHTKGSDPRGVYQLGSVGWLCPSTEMRLVDAETQQDAVPGELWIRGPQVMKGYLNNPTATAETLVDGWLRTGDVGTIDEHGQVYIVDRIKELIKSKGHQVAPAELEGIMLQHPLVTDCAVVGIMDADGSSEAPRAYVVAGGGELGAIAQWFNSKVSRHKQLWGGIVGVSVIPKNNSGKILRRVLRSRQGDQVVFADRQKL